MNNKVKDNLVVAGYCRLSRDEDKENNGGNVGDGNGNGKPGVTTECKGRSD